MVELRVHHIKVSKGMEVLGRFFPRELKEERVRVFLTLKQGSMSIHEYGLMFNHLSRFAPEMVKDMWSKMNLFVTSLGLASSREGRVEILFGDIDICRIIVYVKQDYEEKLRT